LDTLKEKRRALVLIGCVLLAGGALIRRRRAQGPGPRRPARAHTAHHAFERAVRALERRGHSRSLGETGRELATRVAQANDPGARPFAELVELYYAARFGEADVSAVELDRLAREVVRPPARDIGPPASN
jgi:hypothetical protein